VALTKERIASASNGYVRQYPNATAVAFVMLIPEALAQALMETQMIRASNDNKEYSSVIEAFSDGVTAGRAGMNLVEPVRYEHRGIQACHAAFLLGLEQGRLHRADMIAWLYEEGICE
jgi:hypothetical protein